MRAYYDRRAAEYDDWWLGRGLFAARERPGWADEVERLVEVVRGLHPARVLDVACGTGFLTRHLRGDVVGLDQSARMVELASERMPHATVVQGDAVPLPFAAHELDRVFTSHFYGHLLPDERDAFLAEARRVAPELVVVDAARRDDRPAEEWRERTLEDGSRHRVYKRFFEPEGLARELGGGRVLHAGRWFVVVRAGTIEAGDDRGGQHMRIQVKGRSGATADEELRSRVEKKLAKVARQVSPLAELEVELREERNPSIRDSQVAEATLHLKGVTLRASERSTDMGHSINMMADDLARQVKKHRDKRRGRRDAHKAQEHAA